jgi:catechol 2,3-dioxygenase-like lactoylglutathione lyase family enzyme
VIDHVSVAVSDLAAASRFYEAALTPLGYAKLEDRPATVGFGKRYAEFWINLRAPSPVAPSPVAPSSGAHVALRATSIAAVDAFHAAAVAAGGASDGPPGLWPQHGENYYAAFIRDPDGNRIEAVTFPGAT